MKKICEFFMTSKYLWQITIIAIFVMILSYASGGAIAGLRISNGGPEMLIWKLYINAKNLEQTKNDK